ncbi:hypothetical protein GTC6_10606 [Gordonia terrae C-6]|uniref:Uncharacterized protein n=1 Tax=Gordonia terrae C-6 TaxID=1316928 RepID=R7YAN9_9ACTN|nr:hypothetical protein GTC6_10606 [Gordonia terrae C-6]
MTQRRDLLATEATCATPLSTRKSHVFGLQRGTPHPEKVCEAGSIDHVAIVPCTSTAQPRIDRPWLTVW